MGTKVWGTASRLAKCYNYYLWHPEPYLIVPLRSLSMVNTEMIWYQKVQDIPGSWNRLLNPAQAFYGPPTISVWCFLIEASTLDREHFVLPQCSAEEGGTEKCVPVSAVIELMICAAHHHTYCFFWACEARSLAFSLAASAVSLARSVAVSAKVLDGVSPTRVITCWSSLYSSELCDKHKHLPNSLFDFLLFCMCHWWGFYQQHLITSALTAYRWRLGHLKYQTNIHCLFIYLINTFTLIGLNCHNSDWKKHLSHQ